MGRTRALAVVALSGCQAVFPLTEPEPQVCFADRFEGTTLGAPFTGTATETGGQLLVAPSTSASATGFGLTRASIELELASVTPTVANALGFSLAHPPLMVGVTFNATKVSFVGTDDGSLGNSSVFDFDPAIRFIRMVDTAKVVALDTSTDGDLWTTRATVELDLTDDMSITLSVSGASSGGGEARLDNLIIRAPSCEGVAP